MPLVIPKTSTFKTKVLDVVHDCLISSGVPTTDQFQLVRELDADDFRFDARYPDLVLFQGSNAA